MSVSLTVPPLRSEIQPGDFVCDEGAREWCSSTELPCPLCGRLLDEIHVEGTRYQVRAAPHDWVALPPELRLLGCSRCQQHFTTALEAS